MKRLQLWFLVCASCLASVASTTQAQPVAPSAPATPTTTAADPVAPTDAAAGAAPPAASGEACVADPDAPIAGVESCEKRPPPHVDQVPDVASLKTPESPAFMALGIAPSEIQRPTTPTGLAASLANGFVAGGSLPLLQNFALEFSPFWLFPHRRLSYEQVLDQPGRAIVRNLSFSFATSPKQLERINMDGSIDKLDYGRFSVGGRTTLWPGTPTKVAKQCLRYIKVALTAEADELLQAVEAFMAEWSAKPENAEPALALPEKPDAELSVTDPDRYDLLIREYERKVAEAYASSAAHTAWARRQEATRDEYRTHYLRDHPAKQDPRFDRCKSDLHSREGFMTEMAGAYSFAVPKGDVSDFKQTALQTTTGWLTAGGVWEDLFQREVEASLLGVFRVQSARGSINDHGERALLYDVGARVATAFTRYGVSVEGTLRLKRVDPSTAPKETQTLWRLGLSFDYYLAGGMWLTATFAKDFGTEDATPLLALANFQWNFGLERGVKPDTKVTQ